VRIADVDLEERQVDFHLAHAGSAPRAHSNKTHRRKK
jgi:hypothetical protein